MEYLLLKSLAGALTLLSRDSLFRLSETIGNFAYSIPRVKRVSEENLKFCGFEREMGKTAFIYLLKSSVDFLKSRSYSEDFLRSLFSLDEKRAEFLLSMDGGILLTAHIGNWELMGALFSLISGERLSVIAKPLKNRRVNELLNGIREFWKVKVISTGNVAPALRELKRGRFIGILLDQRPKVKEGVLTEFLGRKAYTNRGAAVLSVRTGKPVVPAFCYFEGSRYRVEIHEPIYPEGRGVDELTVEYARSIDMGVRKHPEQWFWVHRRWKNSPEWKKR